MTGTVGPFWRRGGGSSRPWLSWCGGQQLPVWVSTWELTQQHAADRPGKMGPESKTTRPNRSTPVGRLGGLYRRPKVGVVELGVAGDSSFSGRTDISPASGNLTRPIDWLRCDAPACAVYWWRNCAAPSLRISNASRGLTAGQCRQLARPYHAEEFRRKHEYSIPYHQAAITDPRIAPLPDGRVSHPPNLRDSWRG